MVKVACVALSAPSVANRVRTHALPYTRALILHETSYRITHPTVTGAVNASQGRFECRFAHKLLQVLGQIYVCWSFYEIMYHDQPAKRYTSPTRGCSLLFIQKCNMRAGKIESETAKLHSDLPVICSDI